MPSIIPRSDWGAAPARGRTLVKPSRRTAFVVHYDGNAPRSATAGAAAIRATQTFHQRTRGWADIGYNFLVTQDGKIYEGRGWDVLGSHAGPGGNAEGIGVQVHIGGTQQPSDAALASVRWLYDVACKRFGRRLAMKRHRDYMSTSCPGAALSAWVAKGMPAPDSQPAAPAPAPAPAPVPQPEENDMAPIYFEEIRDFKHGGHGWQVITDPPALKVARPIHVSARAVIHGPEGHRLVTRWAMGHDEHPDFWITDPEVIHTSHHAETTLTRWLSRPDVHLALDVYSTEPGPHRLVITGHYWEV